MSTPQELAQLAYLEAHNNYKQAVGTIDEFTAYDVLMQSRINVINSVELFVAEAKTENEAAQAARDLTSGIL